MAEFENKPLAGDQSTPPNTGAEISPSPAAAQTPAPSTQAWPPAPGASQVQPQAWQAQAWPPPTADAQAWPPPAQPSQAWAPSTYNFPTAAQHWASGPGIAASAATASTAPAPDGQPAYQSSQAAPTQSNTWGNAFTPPPPPPPAAPTSTGYPLGYSGYPQWQPPAATPPAAKPKQRRGMTVLAMLVSFLLGIGSFAVGGQLISSLSQTERPSVTQPEQPVQPNQQPNQRSDDNYRNADTSVTAEQSKGIVLIWGISGNSQSAGTGMVLDAAGKILTNYHVVAGTESLTATIVDTGKTYSATVVGFDAQRDVALLQLDDANGLQTVTLDYDTLHNGDAVSVVGNAEGGGVLIRANGQVLGMDQSLTVSSDSPWGAEENLEGLIASNANAVPGDSGGPMFDSQAQVTGMTTAGSQKESMSFAIPIADAMAIVRVIEAGHDEGSVRVGPAGYIGITVVPERGHRLGRQIQEIAKDSPADQAGIAPGSTLTQVDSTEVRGDTNLANVIRALEPGTVVQVTWIDPSGVEHSAAVTLGSSPVN